MSKDELNDFFSKLEKEQKTKEKKEPVAEKPKPPKEESVPEEDKQFRKMYLELLSLRKKVKALEENSEDIERIENETGKTIADLRKNNLELVSKLMAAEKNFEAFKTTKSVLNKHIEDLEDSVKALKTEKTELQDSFTNQITSIKSERDQAKDALRALNEEIDQQIASGLEEKVKNERGELDRQRKELATKQNSIESRESFTGKYGLLMLITAGLLGSMYAYVRLIPSLIVMIPKLSLDYKIIGIVSVVIALTVLGLFRKRRNY
jgi:chromosome segregation ATPase